MHTCDIQIDPRANKDAHRDIDRKKDADQDRNKNDADQDTERRGGGVDDVRC